MVDLVLFRPPADILGRIDFEDNASASLTKHELYYVATPLTSPGPFMMGIYSMIADFYRPIFNWPIDKDAEHIAPSSFLDLINDAITNGLCHGKRGMVMAGAFFGPKGAIYGFRDFGEYFRRREVKSWWEEKDWEKIMADAGKRDDKCVGHASCGTGVGVSYILEQSDSIYIDGDLGVLYAAQNVERFLRLDNIEPEQR